MTIQRIFEIYIYVVFKIPALRSITVELAPSGAKQGFLQRQNISEQAETVTELLLCY